MTTLEQDAPLLILWCACWGKAAMIRSRPMFPGTENMKAATSKAYSFMATIYGVPLKAVSGNSSPKKLLKKLKISELWEMEGFARLSTSYTDHQPKDDLATTASDDGLDWWRLEGEAVDRSGGF